MSRKWFMIFNNMKASFLVAIFWLCSIWCHRNPFSYNSYILYVGYLCSYVTMIASIYIYIYIKMIAVLETHKITKKKMCDDAANEQFFTPLFYYYYFMILDAASWIWSAMSILKLLTFSSPAKQLFRKLIVVSSSALLLI